MSRVIAGSADDKRSPELRALDDEHLRRVLGTMTLTGMAEAMDDWLEARRGYQRNHEPKSPSPANLMTADLRNQIKQAIDQQKCV
jgi:hypothetical protein